MVSAQYKYRYQNRYSPTGFSDFSAWSVISRELFIRGWVGGRE